ncbi:MAG: hypothetical protein WKH47_08750 [Actinomycetes bacterium]
MHRISGVRRHRRRRLAAAAAGTAIFALLTVLPAVGMSGIALATTPPEPPADADASCDTSPTSYPGNGVPVPGGASCVVVTTPAGVPVAEVWAWGDDAGLHWYNYVAEDYRPGGGSALTMCATEDEAADGFAYDCSTDSYSLLFTVADLFVTWPAIVDADLYFCESVDVVGLDDLVTTAHACGTLSGVSRGESVPGPPPSTTPPPADPSAPPTSSPPTPPPTTAPVDPPAEEPVPTTEPTRSEPAAPPSAPIPTSSTPPTAAAPSAPVDATPGRPVADETPPDAAPMATPVDSESVALVGGAAFPVALVVALAAALALGGVAVLAGPSAVTAFRRRT